jgi:hypothetical protein
MTPLERAALGAEQEAESLRAAAVHTMTLEDQSDLLYDVATDAIEAYERAGDRAREARKLADHYSGAEHQAGDGIDGITERMAAIGIAIAASEGDASTEGGRRTGGPSLTG